VTRTLALLAAALLPGLAATATGEPDRPEAEVQFPRKIENRKPVDPGTTFSPGKLYC
jgi:hypothetical protein